MVGYHAGAKSVAATLAPFGLPPLSLAGLAAQVGTQGCRDGDDSVRLPAAPVVGCDSASVPTSRRDERDAVLVSQLPLQHASMLFLPVRILTSPITTLARYGACATRLGPPGWRVGCREYAEPEWCGYSGAFKPLGGQEWVQGCPLA